MTWYKKEMLKSSDFWIGMVNLTIWVGVVFYGMTGHVDMYVQFIGLSSLIIGLNLLDITKKKFEVMENGLRNREVDGTVGDEDN